MEEERNISFGGYMIPESVAARIVDLCSYTAIPSLAKTSQGFRRIVGWIRPTFSVISCEIHVDSKSILFKMNTKDEQLEVKYRIHRKGCMVKRVESKKERFVKRDYDKAFLMDFYGFFGFQLTKTDNFRLNFQFYSGDEEIEEMKSLSEKFVTGLNFILQQRPFLIEAENFSMNFRNEYHAQWLLKHFHAESIRKLELHQKFLPFFEKIGPIIIPYSNQWKQAKELDLGDSVLNCKAKDLIHFEKATVTMSEISLEQLVELRNAFLTSETFRKFELRLIYLDENAFYELFGPPMFSNEWIYGDSELKMILSISVSNRKIIFRRENWEETDEKISIAPKMEHILEEVENAFLLTVSSISKMKMMMNERIKNELRTITIHLDISRAKLTISLDDYTCIKFVYSDHNDGCMNFMGTQKKLLEGQDFISALCEDIEELLRKQRRPYLNNFDLFLHSDPSDDTNNINERQEYVSMKFFEKFEEIMKRKRALLKVKSFNMNPHSQDQLLSVFRHLKPGVLETISLHSKNQTKRLKPDWQLLQSLLEKLPAETRALFTNIEENTNQIMPMLPAEMFDIYGIQSLKEPVNIELEKVVKMDQWKEAKQVITDNLIVSLPLGSLLNFQFAYVKLKYISSDNLLLLKKLLQSGTPINMEIGYVHFSDHDLNNISYRNPFDVFGIPHKNSTSSTRIAELSSDPEKVIVKTWYLPTRDPDFYGCIRHRSDNIFVFSYAKKQGIREEKVIENDWTGLVLLVNVFPVVMENILKVTDLRSRLNLRKVCRDLRNFIDDTRIKTRERRIGISVLFNSIDTRFEENGESVRVYFKGDEEKCIVMREKAKENQKNHSKFDINVVNDLDFLTGFFNELDIALGNHRSILDELQIDFPCFMEEEEVVDHEFGVKVLRRLKQYLEYKYYKISVKRLSINLFHQSQIIDILPYINPDKLEKVELINLKGVTGKLDIQEILKTEQWKKAKELELINFFIGLPAGSLTHFAKVKCCIETIEAQNLMALKTACLASPKEFAIECQSFDTEDLYETFGRPLILVTEGVKTRNWFFRIPNNSENVVSLVIESLSLVTFSRVPVEDVPTNATIHD